MKVLTRPCSSNASREEPSSSSSPWRPHVLLGLWPHHSDLCLDHRAFSLLIRTCVLLSYKDPSRWIGGSLPRGLSILSIQHDLTLITFAKTCFQTRGLSEVPGGRDFVGDSVQSIPRMKGVNDVRKAQARAWQSGLQDYGRVWGTLLSAVGALGRPVFPDLIGCWKRVGRRVAGLEASWETPK